MTKKSILNSLNFFNTNDRFFHDKVVPSFEEKKYFITTTGTGWQENYILKGKLSAITIEY